MHNILEIFWRFLLLGCTSFGGPAAHIGYFRRTFVEERKWLQDDDYAHLLALSQFLPGPASSQVGFAIGLRRGGLPGGLAAFLGFTLPSFLLLTALAIYSVHFTQSSVLNGLIHGLKLLAVVVVTDATLGMAEKFCRGRLRTLLAVATAATLWILPGIYSQMLCLLLAATAGTLWIAPATAEHQPQPLKPNWLALTLFALIFAALPLLSRSGELIRLFADFYRTGSLVFGGGHVVLPLLQESVGAAVETDRFLLGYASAQAIPGPMFTLSSFLGAELLAERPWLGAVIATGGIFLPGFLLVIAFHHSWSTLTRYPRIAGAAAGINASVVGLLLAALYQPVFVSAVQAPVDMALVFVGLFALRALKLPILALVLGFALAGLGLGVL